MAKASKTLIDALRTTAKNIQSKKPYEWGHMGACNCGNLAQVVTSRTKAEIHEYAMRGKGDWSEQVDAFCPTSNMPMDLLISDLISCGLSLEDLIHLERLTDKEVLALIPKEERKNLKHNKKEDVALYMSAWANLLEIQLQKPLQGITSDVGVIS